MGLLYRRQAGRPTHAWVPAGHIGRPALGLRSSYSAVAKFRKKVASHGPLVAVEDRVKGAQSRPWRPEIRNQTVCVWRGRKKLHYLNPVPLQALPEIGRASCRERV